MAGENLVNSIRDFYPRSPCGERHADRSKEEMRLGISIHALLAESDVKKLAQFNYTAVFLSTLSLRRATDSRR